MYDIFSLPDIRFPEGFIWGSATAGHQIEGNNIHSQWWKREQEGKLPQPSGMACNNYALYRQDVELVKALGHKAFRLSVEWSRIEPSEGIWDKEALFHYIDFISRLSENGIQVFVTLHHFTHPQWFENLGGFMKRENLRYFERYVNYIVPLIAEYVSSWNVINEFNLGWDPAKADYKINMILAHARGYHIIKQHSKAPVSSAHAFVYWYPYRAFDPIDRTMTNYVDYMDNEFFFNALRTGEIIYPFRDAEYFSEVKGAIDYWAVNYYTRHFVDSRKKNAKGKVFDHKLLNMIDMDFYLKEMFPEGLIACIERLKDKPVFITENGCSCDDDKFRILYIALHLSALKEAMDRGVDVRGYFYWSMMDNYEWGSFVPRFGLVDVNFETFTRTPKPSADFYREIIENNGLTQHIIRKYLDRLPVLKQKK